VGHVEEFYFDESAWTIKYLLVATGGWLSHRPVVVPADAIEPDWSVAGLSVKLTKEQVRDRPGAEPTPIVGYHLEAADGGIGHVDDFLFDEQWIVHYLVIDTSNFIGGRSVVISPAALHDIDRSHQTMQVALTREQVKGSPSFDSIDVAPGEGVRIWMM
jgi:hypothetical protein